MKIGIITLSRISAKQEDFYNLQDVGLAKALAKMGHTVILYRLTHGETYTEENEGVTIVFRKATGIGKQSITWFSFLDPRIKRLICFSDNQVSFPNLYKWCKKRNILLQPYIGVIESNSPNILVASIANLLVKRNIKIYCNMNVYGKTPTIIQKLEKVGVKKCELVPVCLDEELLHQEVEIEELKRIRCQYGYDKKEKIVLFVGRMEPEKEPLLMIDIFHKLLEGHPNYRLLMIGKGALHKEVQSKVKVNGLDHLVQFIEAVPNQEMWKMYCISDCIVNLNRNEIYGMSILEALYYRCPVIAIRAPGPDYILGKNQIGYLCSDEKQVMKNVIKAVENKQNLDNTRRVIEEEFLWKQKIERFLP